MLNLFRTICALIIVFSGNIFAGTIECKVIAISDGDTFTCLKINKESLKIRLAGIDTPEKGQPYGQKSRSILAKMIFKKNVIVLSQGTDRYKRTIGEVYLDDIYINRELVKAGAAWVYRQYNKDLSLLADEESARIARIGIWSQPESEIVPPWEWRKAGQNLHQTVRDSKSSYAAISSNSCGAKRYCAQMSSCEEANFYLESCGLRSLDRDGNGVPCEKLCRR